MNQEIINEVLCQMIPHLSNDQIVLLKNVLEGAMLKSGTGSDQSDEVLVDSFIAAKRLEGCSDRTLVFYRNTIDKMLTSIGKNIKAITTDDLRGYLSEYQNSNMVSKVTIDNIRRNLSSFFSWLEDENYILKSPVRRIHRVKATTSVKETYTDEDLERLRDNCTELRDLALIDILASTGMRVGDDDDKIRLNQRKPSKYKGLSRFGPEKNLQRINKFMKERPIFYKNLIQMKENFRFYLRCFYCITKVVILQFNSENRTELARNG